MQYFVKGKLFNENELEKAKEYEKELEAKEIEKRKKDNEKNCRLKELKNLEKEYVDKVNEFCKDYGYYKIDLNGLKYGFNLFDNFFNF